jgi:hypothetical protein
MQIHTMVVDRAGRDFWSHARLSLGRANMFDAYLESHLYSDPQYAIIRNISPIRDGHTGQCLLESVRRETILAKGTTSAIP